MMLHYITSEMSIDKLLTTQALEAYRVEADVDLFDTSWVRFYLDRLHKLMSENGARSCHWLIGCTNVR